METKKINRRRKLSTFTLSPKTIEIIENQSIIEDESKSKIVENAIREKYFKNISK